MPDVKWGPIDWDLINGLMDKEHPLLNTTVVREVELPLGVGEVLYEARSVHHLLDMAGVPRRLDDRHNTSDVDVRVYLLVKKVQELRARLKKLEDDS